MSHTLLFLHTDISCTVDVDTTQCTCTSPRMFATELEREANQIVSPFFVDSQGSHEDEMGGVELFQL